MLNGLDLFSGIGGVSIALSQWVRPVAYCEIDPYCQGVLLSLIRNKQLELAPIWDNIRSFSSSLLPKGCVDIIYGGFPCQDISIATNGKGLDGERSGLFFELLRLVQEFRPYFLFLENVPAICSRGGNRIVKEIKQMGMDCRWLCISAESVGAKHKRERWFLLAYSRRELPWCEEISILSPMATSLYSSGCCRKWEVEPSVDRVADGVQFRSHRIRALGNSVVPEQAKKAFEILMGLTVLEVK